MGFKGSRASVVPWSCQQIQSIISFPPAPAHDQAYFYLNDYQAPFGPAPVSDVIDWFYYGYFDFYTLCNGVGAAPGFTLYGNRYQSFAGTPQPTTFNIFNDNPPVVNQIHRQYASSPDYFSHFNASVIGGGTPTAVDVVISFIGLKVSAA